MAHILFITSYYPPEKGAAPVRISETAKRLVKRGYQVTVLTTVPNYPTGIVPPEYRGRVIQQEIRDDVHIIRVWSYISPNTGFLHRVLMQLSFGCLAPILGAKATGQPDLLIVESHPLFNAIAGRLLAWLKRCPFIFTVSDLWPESAVQLGVLRNSFLIRLAEWLEWSTYRRAGYVWALTEGIRRALIERGLSEEHILLLRNGVDTARFHPLPQVQARRELGWDNQFTVLYAGNHGLSQGLATILDATKQLDHSSNIRFVLVGDGSAKTSLVAEAQRRNLKNVIFLDSQPYDLMPTILAAADVCLVPLRKLTLFEGALPSKMYEAMACARPIILGVEGEAKQLIEKDAGAAIAVEPENATALAAAIVYLRDHPQEAELLGQRGRTFVEAHYDRDQLITKLDEYIALLLDKHAPASSSTKPPAIEAPEESRTVL